MPGDTRLLIAFDDSAAAAAAVRAAGRLFPGAQARLVHGLEAAEPRGGRLAERGRDLAQAAALLGSIDMRPGRPPWRAVVAAADEIDPDVVVCGARGHGTLARALIGSTSSAVLHHGRHPLLIVPAGDEDRAGGPVVVGYDGSRDACAAITEAARLFPARELIVVHGWSSPVDRSYAGWALSAVPVDDVQQLTDDMAGVLAADAQASADEGATMAAEAGATARGVAEDCGPGARHALAAVARRERAAVIVAGRRGRGAMRSGVLGSVSAGLVHHAELPVLIVR